MPVVDVVYHFLRWNLFDMLLCDCSEFRTKPNQKDLAQAFLLLQSLVMSDPKLQASPVSTSSYMVGSSNAMPFVSVYH